MDLTQNASVHNRFDVTVLDANTGAVKQTAVGYNIILNQWFYYLAQVGTMKDDALQAISIGTGTGTLSPEGTALFTYLGRKTPTDVEVVYDYPTSYITREIRLEASEYNGSTITEVGFMSAYSGMYYHQNTHAFLKDSEGNQIAIEKTDSDVVIIRGTFYVSFSATGFGANAALPAAASNGVVNWLFGKASFPATATFSRYQNTQAQAGLLRCHGKKTTTLSECTRTYATFTIDYPVFIWGDTEHPNHTVSEIGMPGIAVMHFPDADVFTPLVVNRHAVGTGDGVTTEFDIGSPYIVPDSETVYIDGVALTRGTDYTVDPASNMIDMRENYWSAEYSALDSNVEFGNLKARTKSASEYKDPIAWWNCYCANSYPVNCMISAANPIWIDFLQPRACNRMKFELITVPSAQISNMVVEYSTDNETWTAASTVRDGQVWTFDEISARYWRVYIPGYNWTYTLQSSVSTVRDTQTFGTSFFLGRVAPSLVFTTQPAAGAAIEATFTLERPLKTANNLLKFTCSLVLSRGEGS